MNANAKKLQQLGLRSRFDLVLHLPLRYEDETALTPVDAAPQGVPVQVDARVERAEVAFRPRRQLVVRAEGLVLRFYNFYGSQLKQFQRAAEQGLHVRAYGEVRPGFFGAEMVHPRYKLVPNGEPLPETLTPIYPTTAGLAQGALRKAVLDALDDGPLDDTLPPWLRRKFQLGDFAAAVGVLHRPPPGADLVSLAGRTHPAWQRMKFDELLAQQLTMKLAYRRRRRSTAPALPADGRLLTSFRGRLPFRLTRAQARAVDEVLRDLAEAHPMQRLLQGDVGSGKTIVAAIACLAAADAGMQAAVMAPTEILAEQHWRKFGEWLRPLGVPMVWLHGGLARKDKAGRLKELREGKALVAIGTHALFQKGVEFARLGLVVVDEQHRFGVQQRLLLREKGGNPVPHQLMMSATPIPRSLAMTYMADLDLSVIDEMPPGRTPVATHTYNAQRRPEVLTRIRDACAEGQQAYWVCPVIEESKTELQTAIDTYETLRSELSGLRVALLHGRMAPEEKNATMAEFAAGRIQLLVCTTVIEVGVDVANASLMVIEHAERFGLAQLHQLRGRIGRGARASACVLLFAEPLSEEASKRLRAIREHGDGFKIAELDLKQRGPGEVLGVRARQSGHELLRFADPEKDAALLEQARRAADEFIAREPQAAQRHAQRWYESGVHS